MGQWRRAGEQEGPTLVTLQKCLCRGGGGWPRETSIRWVAREGLVSAEVGSRGGGWGLSGGACQAPCGLQCSLWSE